MKIQIFSIQPIKLTAEANVIFSIYCTSPISESELFSSVFLSWPALDLRFMLSLNNIHKQCRNGHNAHNAASHQSVH